MTADATPAGPWVDLGAPQTIALPSGQRVSIVLPDLLSVASTGEIPSALLDWVEDYARQNDDADGDRKPDTDRTLKAVDRMRQLARVIVVDEFTEQQWRCAPVLDVLMLGAIALRNRTEDADGTPIRGLAPAATFREGPEVADDAATAPDDGGTAQATPERPAGRARSRAGVAAG